MLGALVGAGATGAALATAHLIANLRALRVPPRGVAPSGLVSVCIPARDEADRIGPAVRAVLSSRDVELELVVCDDRSGDGTADAVRRAARGDGRLRVIAGAEPPPGWLGKAHACAQLAAEARGDVLVFVDADVVVAPQGIARTVGLLDCAGLDLASPYPRQLALSPAERLVQPLLQWSWLSFLPLRVAESSAAPSMAVANGQLLAVRRRALEAAGGFAAVRDEVLDDLALARAVRRAGGRVALADGTDLATCRMYRSWEEVRDGYSKSLWAAFGSPAGAVAVGGVLAWLYVLPPVAAVGGVIAGRRDLAGIGAAGWAAAALGRGLAAGRTRGNVRDAWTHPASIAVLLGLCARSWREQRRGSLTWRGRSIHVDRAI